MSPKQYDDFDDSFHFQRRIQQLIQSRDGLLHEPVQTWRPDADIVQSGGRYLIFMEIPGVKRDDLEILFEDQELKIRGIKPVALDTASGNFNRMERGFGEFRRIFRFEESIDQDRIDAVIRNGVLCVTIYKKKSRRAVEIAGE